MVVPVYGQLSPYYPNHEEIVERYKHMVLLDSITKNTIFKTNITANWQKDSKRFLVSQCFKGQSDGVLCCRCNNRYKDTFV